MRLFASAVCILTVTMALSAPARAGGLLDPGDWDYLGLPGLTQDQKNQMDDLRMGLLRETLVREANLRTLSVEIAVLLTAEKPDMSAIQQKLDQVQQLTAEIHQRGIRLLVGVKALLKKDQAKAMDTLLMTLPDGLMRCVGSYAAPGGPGGMGSANGPGMRGPGGSGQGPGQGPVQVQGKGEGQPPDVSGASCPAQDAPKPKKK